MKKYIIIFIVIILLLININKKEYFINDINPTVSPPLRYVSYDLRCSPLITTNLKNIIYNKNEVSHLSKREKCLI